MCRDTLRFFGKFPHCYQSSYISTISKFENCNFSNVSIRYSPTLQEKISDFNFMTFQHGMKLAMMISPSKLN